MHGGKIKNLHKELNWTEEKVKKLFVLEILLTHFAKYCI